MSKDGFMGAWRVSEYVHDPDGCFVGVVRQRRELERLENGYLRVTQRCAPDAALARHPMGRFAGTWVFDLSVDGPARLYHGPDVVGSGFAWGEGALTGRGLWPRFGHNFTSFAVLVTPERQLTGGQFFDASQMVANVVGVAVPEVCGQWPELTGVTRAGDVAARWVGTKRRVDPAGTVLFEDKVERRYDGQTFQEGDFRLYLTPARTKLECRGTLADANTQGLAKQTGPLLEGELVLDARRLLTFKEVLDAEAGHLVSLRRLYKDQQLDHVEVFRLRPKGKA